MEGTQLGRSWERKPRRGQLKGRERGTAVYRKLGILRDLLTPLKHLASWDKMSCQLLGSSEVRGFP